MTTLREMVEGVGYRTITIPKERKTILQSLKNSRSSYAINGVRWTLIKESDLSYEKDTNQITSAITRGCFGAAASLNSLEGMTYIPFVGYDVSVSNWFVTNVLLLNTPSFKRIKNSLILHFEEGEPDQVLAMTAWLHPEKENASSTEMMAFMFLIRGSYEPSYLAHFTKELVEYAGYTFPQALFLAANFHSHYHNRFSRGFRGFPLRFGNPCYDQHPFGGYANPDRLRKPGTSYITSTMMFGWAFVLEHLDVVGYPTSSSSRENLSGGYGRPASLWQSVSYANGSVCLTEEEGKKYVSFVSTLDCISQEGQNSKYYKSAPEELATRLRCPFKGSSSVRKMKGTWGAERLFHNDAKNTNELPGASGLFISDWIHVLKEMKPEFDDLFPPIFEKTTRDFDTIAKVRNIP